MNELETILQSLDEAKPHVDALRLLLRAARFNAMHADIATNPYDAALTDLEVLASRLKGMSEDANARYDEESASV